jgi:hypothetical protein
MGGRSQFPRDKPAKTTSGFRHACTLIPLHRCTAFLNPRHSSASPRPILPKPRPHPHRVMPRQRKRPPHQRPQQCLPHCQRQNIPLCCKQPRHRYSPDKRQGHQHRIRPVQRAKQRTRHHRRWPWLLKRRHQSVRQKGIESHLLQQTKRQVPAESPRLDQVSWQPVRPAQKQPCETDQQGTNPKEPSRPFRCPPQIICAPSHGLRRITACQKTRRQPHQDHPPSPWRRHLKFPDECSYESRERQRFDQARPPIQAPLHADCPMAFRFSSGFSSINSSRCSNSLSMSSVSPFLPK